MRAVICSKFGEPEELKVLDVPDILPGEGQVRIAIEACGVNFPDTLIIKNAYQYKPKLPFSPGGEVTGKIDALGTGVTNYNVGDNVMAMTLYGGFSEQIVVDAFSLLKRPLNMEAIIAAGFTMTYGTSMHALKQRANLQPGESLLVLGAGGGVGLAAVEIGKAMGAIVIAAASSDLKLKAAKRAGADHLINYEKENFREQIRASVGTKGVDVVFDPVGGNYFEPALRSTSWNGRVLVVGFASGKIPQVPANLPLLKGCAVVGVFWGAFRQKQTDLDNQNFKQLFSWFEDGKINPYISDCYSLDETSLALRKLISREAIGKIVVTT